MLAIRGTFLHKPIHIMSFTAFSLLNCSVLHLLLWLIRVCLSALSPQVFYQLECLVICRLFFNPRFVKSDLSLSQIFLPFLLRLMLMRRSTWVLLPVLNYLEPFPIFFNMNPAKCLYLLLLHLYFLLWKSFLKLHLYLFWKSLWYFNLYC